MTRAKVVFLYTEIAGYFLSCVKELTVSADVLIVRWPVNNEAPFDLSGYSGLQIVDRTKVDETLLRQKVKDFHPDILICSGWIDKGYLKIAKSFQKKIPVVLSLDNHWKGTLKQRIASLISPFYLKRIFTHAWVPGELQAQFARHLGFGNNLLKNFYCADTGLFEQIYKNTFKQKELKFPHRFLYVARYVEHKGIFEMWNAFLEFKNETSSDWELWCIGTGSEWENKINGEGITHFGFVQPKDLEKYISDTGVYVLPSKFEPWGVSVQEFAICGFPLLLSGEVGSSDKFMDERNGIKFNAGAESEILHAMKVIAAKSDHELIEMGKFSHEKGTALNQKIWCETILSVLKKK